MILSIDPGVKALGWALWEDTGLLIGCGLSRTKERDLSDAIADHRRQLSARLGSIPIDVSAVEAMEWTGRAAGIPQDLLDVQAVGCSVARGALRLYRPSRWKGTTPKRVHHERLRGVLIPQELGILDCGLRGIPRGHHKEILDALGIGCYHLKRTNRSGSRRR